MKSLEIQSTITSTGELRIQLEEVVIVDPGPAELVVRVEAAPVNPSDLGALLGPADVATLRKAQADGRLALTGEVPPEHIVLARERLDEPQTVGIEGAGTVVRAGAEVADLAGRRVALLFGGTYAQLRTVPASQCTPLPDSASSVDGAAIVVNPMTALSMLEFIRRDAHSALVHTAAASNLGQILAKTCIADGIGLVNVVRRDEQVELLRSLGAEHVVNSNSPNFEAELLDAIVETGATLAFDAVGGGPLAGTVLRAMDEAATRGPTSGGPHGSSTTSHVYVYSDLDPGPTILDRPASAGWSIAGFHLVPAMEHLSHDTVTRMRERVLSELTTTFASHYSETIGLTDLLDPDIIISAASRGTRSKYLLDPTRS